MSSDQHRVLSLLQIVEKCAGHAGKLSSIQSWAMNELHAINAEMKAATKANVPAEPQPPGDAEREEEPDSETIFTADNPNPNLADRRV